MRNKNLLIISILISIFISSCTKKKTELWVYTSMYEDVIDQLRPVLEKELPDVDVKWFAAGSEKVLAKVNAEISANQLKADVIMTSDPFWSEKLARDGLLLAYDSPAAKTISKDFKNPDNFWVTVRIPVMVISYNKDVIKSEDAPRAYKDLVNPKWKGKVALGSPLESGTNFTTVANLSMKYGWEYYKALRNNETFSSGGNSTVRQKMESKEYPVGVILLENILQAQKSGSPIMPVYPTDGAVLVPSPIAIFKRTHFPDAAKRFYDFMFSQSGQYAITTGNMYSPIPDFPPPEGAKPFAEVLATAFPFNHKYIEEVLKNHDDIKKKYSQIMFE